MKRYYLYLRLGNGKHEYQQVDKSEWESSRASLSESLNFNSLYSYPDDLGDGTIGLCYWAVFNDGVNEWESEFGFTVGSDFDSPVDLGDDDFFDIDKAIEHMFRAGCDDVIEIDDTDD